MQKSGPKEAQRIAKLLARAGVASRREIERMIAEGRVAIDGVAVETPATLLTSLRGVTVDGEAVQEASPARLFLFNKPAGTLTAAVDYNGRKTIYDVLPDDLPRLMPVGRLDLNTEGLLLLTTDGELKRQLELPATGVERSYRARAYGDVTQAQLEDLIDGVEVDGVRYGPIDANLERRTGANVWVEMVLTEGKNREVRRVLEYLGLQVSRLIRTRYGPFVLGDLPPGGIGEVRQVDLIQFRASLKGNKAKAVEEARANPVTVKAPSIKRDPTPQIDPASPLPGQGRGRGWVGPKSVDMPAKPVDGAKPGRTQRPSTSRPTPSLDQGGERGRRARVATSYRAESDPSPDRARSVKAGPTRAPAKAGPAAATGRRSPTMRPSPEKEEGGRSNRTRRGQTTRADRPAKAYEGREQRDELATSRPRAPRPEGEPTTAKPRPKRGAGWAKPKPKPRPGKPRKPRA